MGRHLPIPLMRVQVKILGFNVQVFDAEAGQDFNGYGWYFEERVYWEKRQV